MESEGKKYMKFLFLMGHPAHYHLFKNTIAELKSRGHTVFILIKTKDILEDLLNNSDLEYFNMLKGGRKDTKLGIVWGVVRKEIQLFRFCLKYKPDLLIGTMAEIAAHVGKVLNIPSINVNEDDARIIYTFSKITNPFITHLLSPEACDNSEWNYKTIKYKGYHKLTYLHPNQFTPDEEIFHKYSFLTRPYFIIRFVKLTAHHDRGARGINTRIAENLISVLKPYGNIWISSERELEPEFEKYRLKIDPLDIHNVMSFAKIFIGDSQSMAVEAAMLGVPFIRFNDFIGKIGVLNEIENKYKLGYGIRTNEEEKLFTILQEMLDNPNLSNEYKAKRDTMLSEKIDVTQFYVWFFENYPQSVEVLKNDQNYQNRFLS